MIPKNEVTRESPPEMSRFRDLAESLGLKFDDLIQSGSQANVIGIRSETLLFSQRLDSRTYFVQDARYGPRQERGIWEATDEDYLSAAGGVLERLEIPASEIADARVLKERTQVAEMDQDTGKPRIEKPEWGKVYATFARQIDGIPVWSSSVIAGFTKNRSVGFLQAHWPEIPRAIVAEARRLVERVKGEWKPPEHPGAIVESVEAGIVHSPAVGFLMDVYPAIRVIYAPIDERMGQKATRYFDRHGNDVPVPRQFDVSPEPPMDRRVERNGRGA
jgi:hypothetical protein